MPRKLIVLFVALVCSIGLIALPVTAEEAVKQSTSTPSTDTEIKDGLSDDERAAVVEMLEKSRSELEALVASGDPEQWATRSDPERWSVGEVVEHLVLAEEGLTAMIHGALAAEPDPEWAQIAAGGTDGLITTVQDRSQKFQAPEVMQPKGEATRDDMLARYATLRAKTLDFARSVKAPVKRHTASGPAGKMNVHQWLALIGAHNLRHNQQIAEVLEQLK